MTEQQDSIENSTTSTGQIPPVLTVQREIIHITGYSPEVLQKFEEVLAGSAEKLFDNMLEESRSRREIEREMLERNIKSQEQNLDNTKRYIDKSFLKELFGQILGFIVCMTCIGAAVYLGTTSPEHWKIPVAITTIPTATVIWAFRGKIGTDKKQKEDNAEDDTPV